MLNIRKRRLALLIASISAVGATAIAQQNTPFPGPKMLSAKQIVDKAGEASPEARLIIGRGNDYVPIAEDPAMLFERLEGSMAQRRATGWRIVEAMLGPQTLTAGNETFEVPLWHTWYEGMASNPEVDTKIKLFFSKIRACMDQPSCAKTREEIAIETMADTAIRPQNKSMARSLSDANFRQVLNQHKSFPGIATHDLGTGFTLFSPSFVEHVLKQAKGLEDCPLNEAKPDDPPPSSSQFSPCMTEFPRSAVMVKTSWVSPGGQTAVHETDATSMSALFGKPLWGEAGTVPMDPAKMYSIQTKEGSIFGLQSIHFSTKDTREWLWVSLWWSPEPNTDFGADRPASIARFGSGVWANYKMCITSSFNERDTAPGRSFSRTAPTLATALTANHAALKTEAGAPPRVTTWCSNPNLENHPNNHRTNCIGCHQYSLAKSPLTRNDTRFFETLSPANNVHFPQFGRDRKRANFPADFSWSLSTTIENVPGKIRDAREALQVPKL